MKRAHLIFFTLLLGLNSHSHGYSVQNNEKKSVPQTSSRRSFLAIPAISIPLSFIKSREAGALQPKNEALCGTGFFEHIYEYKCTAIGDIQDEGNAKDLSSKEVDMTDSLMGKLGLSAEGSFRDVEKDRKVAETKKIQEGGQRKEVKNNSKKQNVD